ncbi:MAG: hypothetical protein IJU39_00895 [Clostridia bacterium]|nr:hypothetical protein [Clostridia bacterium]
MKITDKIVTVLLSALTIPVAIFAPLVHILYNITAWGLIEQLAGSSSSGDSGLTEDTISVKWLFEKLINGDFSFGEIDKSNFTDAFKAIYPFLIAAGILFALAALTGVVLFATAVVSRAKKTQCVISGVGIALLIACGITFSKFASPIVSGTVTAGSVLQSLFGESLSSLTSILTSSVIEVQRLNLTTAWSVMMVLFFAVIIWNVSYMLTSSEEKADQ